MPAQEVIPLRQRELVSFKHAEELTDLSLTTLYGLEKDGHLETKKIRGRRLIVVTSLLRLIDGDRAPKAAA